MTGNITKKEVEIHVFDYPFIRTGVVDEYESSIFIRRHNEVGEFEITISKASTQAKMLKVDAFVMFGLAQVKFGIINHEEYDSSTELFKFKGETLNRIFAYREAIVNYNEVDSHEDGYAENIIRAYVDTHCINPTNPSRKIELLQQTPSNNLGENIRWKNKNTSLLDGINPIAEIYNLGYRILGDYKNKRWLFDVYQGKDLSINQTQNPRVVFSADNENIEKISYIRNTYDERNVALIITSGAGQSKVLETGDVKGLKRREIVFNIDDYDADNQYTDILKLANEQLKEYYNTYTVDARIINTKQFICDVDYTLGDLVTIYDQELGINENLHITEIEEICTKDGLNTYATFGKRIIPLLQKMKREMNVINL